MTHHSIRNFARAIRALAASAALMCAGCADNGGESVANTVVLNLDFGGGVTLTTLNYALKGPGTFKRTGTLSVGDSTTVQATFQSLPAGDYSVQVQGTATDDSSFCRGQTTFTVVAMTNAVVNIPLTCTGRASVAADVVICPVIDSVSALPSEVHVGSTIQLVAVAHDPASVPSPIVATWTASSGSSGTLSNASITGATFTCTAVGTFSVSLTISHGTPVCGDTTSVMVTCSEPM